MRFLLDTCIISFALRQRHGVDAVLQRHDPAHLLLSSVVQSEGRTGAYRSDRPQDWIRRWDLLTAGWRALPFDHAAAEHYGRIRAHLERAGAMIGHRDCQIAATALAWAEQQRTAVTVITDNVDEFRCVPGLRVDNWAAAR